MSPLRGAGNYRLAAIGLLFAVSGGYTGGQVPTLSEAGIFDWYETSPRLSKWQVLPHTEGLQFM